MTVKHVYPYVNSNHYLQLSKIQRQIYLRKYSIIYIKYSFSTSKLALGRKEKKKKAMKLSPPSLVSKYSLVHLQPSVSSTDCQTVE